MKKTYQTPNTQIVVMNLGSVILQGSITINSNGGHATVSPKDAQGDAMVKGQGNSGYNVWDDDWSN